MMPQWNDRTHLQLAQFEWEEELQLRPVRLVSASAQVGDPVRVTVAGVEVEGRIESVASSTSMCASVVACSSRFRLRLLGNQGNAAGSIVTRLAAAGDL